jgi:hypothetical protein
MKPVRFNIARRWHNACSYPANKPNMIEITTTRYLDSTESDHDITSQRPESPRMGASRFPDSFSIMHISTTKCMRCSHTFLRYAATCPECGLVIRRRKRHKGRAKALLCSAVAIALTCLFVSQRNSTDNTIRHFRNYPSLASVSPISAGRQTQEPTKVRYIIVREADLPKIPVGPRITSK